jgi:hypothetical protein
VPNGLKASGGSAPSLSGVTWSGLYSSASGPQTDLSRCRAADITITEVPAGNRYRPPITVSSRAYRLNPGAVGHSRSVSLRTCVT